MKVLGRSHQSARKKSLRKKTLGKLSIPYHSYYCMVEKKNVQGNMNHVNSIDLITSERIQKYFLEN